MARATYSSELKSALGGTLGNLESASLRMHKFSHLSKTDKKEELEATVRISEKMRSQEAGRVRALPSADRQFSLSLGGRMMVNKAGGLIESSGLCLHRFFGYPMIPGSALKGIARAYAWELWKFAEEGGELNDALSLARQMNRIFGYPSGDKDFDQFCERHLSADELQASAGRVAFLPAQPADNTWQLVVDVLTPHGDSDTKNPIPNFFLAVEKGTSFSFALKVVKSRGTDEDVNLATEWLKQSLMDNGVGAKTAAGYGWFTDSYKEPKKTLKVREQKKRNSGSARQQGRSRIQSNVRI